MHVWTTSGTTKEQVLQASRDLYSTEGVNDKDTNCHLYVEELEAPGAGVALERDEDGLYLSEPELMDLRYGDQVVYDNRVLRNPQSRDGFRRGGHFGLVERGAVVDVAKLAKIVAERRYRIAYYPRHTEPFTMAGTGDLYGDLLAALRRAKAAHDAENEAYAADGDDAEQD